MTGVAPVTVTPLPGMPEVQPGAPLAEIVVAAVQACGAGLVDGDVLVVSSKVVSKALGLTVPDADRTQVVAGESRRVVAERVTSGGLTRIVASAAGPVMAAAGVDASNTGAGGVLLLLPHDPDAAARDLRAAVTAAWRRVAGAEVCVGVIISDTAGRPWRAGQTDFALGAAGVAVVDDLRGGVDADGRPLQVTVRCLADEVAAAADLVKGKDRHIPVALVRGLGRESGGAGQGAANGAASDPTADGPGAASIVRTGPEDWFAYGQAEAVRASLGVEPGSATAVEVGVAPAWPEDRKARVARAIAVALHEHEGVEATDESDAVRLRGHDAFGLGVVAARLCSALWGEGLAAAPHRAAEDPPSVRIVITGPTA
jgi:coenzyme F420-0:L-glutamate ligase / coenzyme F420-1:gamma-L-glutamate ligase